MITISDGFYDYLVNVPLLNRLHWPFTWQLFITNLFNGKYLSDNGNACEFLSILLSSLNIFKQCYRHVDPFSVALVFMGVVATIHYFVSIVTNNYSQVDKSWSILPSIYAWHFFYNDYLNRGTIHPRLLLGAILITLWGFRLTLNFARKGGYEWKGQDYRYPYIKSKIGPIAMGLLNITVIAPFQDTLLLFMVSPLYLTNLTYQPDTNASLTVLDLVATGLFTLFLGIEMIADEQQYVFQTEKYCLFKHMKGKQLVGDYHRGFLTQGLFKYSRHPNFFAEMGIWWSIYLFSVSASTDVLKTIPEQVSWLDPWTWINWTIVGPLTLTLLFQGSTWLTERISSEKYPEYKIYQQKVNRFFPWRSSWKTLSSTKHD
ncbi:uncharacterized protein BX664DRAFT_332860 [Halteromyces radiatus]|uniref:uncharacterized protein n=1 Tax=Halteromyces radiatus TaxID=101107 RepID=UPI00221F8BEB|nr:uncharacterized protein BX664DRAFT_332860 [Halteromyces radiatus]KAI8089369.1 hypothetical protein BX664DRAFT_332860 [Halteromyces radiatus]